MQTLNAAQRVQLWSERVAECRSSGMSVRAWCRENEISEETYYYWQRRLYQQMISATQRVDFAEIPSGIQTGQKSTGAAAKVSEFLRMRCFYTLVDLTLTQELLFLDRQQENIYAEDIIRQKAGLPMSLDKYTYPFSRMDQDSNTNEYDTGFSVAAIYSLLYELGITATNTGFFHISLSVLLATENPKRLLLVAKWIFPKVAEHYETNVGAVEHNISTIIRHTWQLNRDALERIAGYPLEEIPTPSQFIAILYAYLQSKKAA